jgi:hypothetical protein
VHGKHDDPQAKLDALSGWVSEFESAHDGRSPSIYLGGVCADLSPVELLEHMPAYLARSERLLILAGPALPEQLWCAMECYAWVALGGSVEDVDVAIVAPSDAANVRAIINTTITITITITTTTTTTIVVVVVVVVAMMMMIIIIIRTDLGPMCVPMLFTPISMTGHDRRYPALTGHWPSITSH